MAVRQGSAVKQWIAAGVLVAAAGAAVLAQTSRAEVEQAQARQRISTMEDVLARAVMNGAQAVLRTFNSRMIDSMMLTSAPEVRGFRLEGYGVFFDVEVPGLQPSIAWDVRRRQNEAMVFERLLQELRSMAARLPRTGPADNLPELIRQVELLAPAGPRRAGIVSPLPPDQSEIPIQDPDELWTREVKSALVESMLEYGGTLGMGDSDWLTVAARDNLPRDPLVAGGLDFSTVIFRIRGSDVAAYQAKRITKDEAVKKVEIREI